MWCVLVLVQRVRKTHSPPSKAITLQYSGLSAILGSIVDKVNAQGEAMEKLQAEEDTSGKEEALEERLKALEEATAAANAAAAAADKAAANAAAVGEANAAKLEALEAKIASLATDVSNVVALAAGAASKDDLDAGLAKAKDGVDGLASRLGSLASSLPTTYAGKDDLDRLDTRLARLEAALDEREAHPAPSSPETLSASPPVAGGNDYGQQVADLQAGENVLKARMDALGAQVKELEGKMGILGDQMADVASSGGPSSSGDTNSSAGVDPSALGKLSGDVSKLKLLRPEIDTIKHSLASLRSSVGESTGREGEIEALLATIEATLKNVDALAEKNAAGLADLDSRVSALAATSASEASLDSLRSNLESLKAMFRASGNTSNNSNSGNIGAGDGGAASGEALNDLASRVAWLESRPAPRAAGGTGGGGGGPSGPRRPDLVKYRLDRDQETEDMIVLSPLNFLGDVGLSKDDLAVLQEPLALALDDKAEHVYVEAALNELDDRLRALAEFASDKLEALASGLRSRASVKDMREMEEDLLALIGVDSEGSFATAGRLHFRCLSCNRSTPTVSGPASALYTQSLSRPATASIPRPPSSSGPARAPSRATSSFSFPRAPARPSTSSGTRSSPPKTTLYPVTSAGGAPTPLFGTDHRVYHGRVGQTQGLPSSLSSAAPTSPSRTILNRPPLPPAHGIPGHHQVEHSYTETYEIVGGGGGEAAE